MRMLGWSLVVGACVWAVGCGDDGGGGDPCEAGQTEPCQCPDGQTAQRTCQADGTFGGCECNGASTGVTTTTGGSGATTTMGSSTTDATGSTTDATGSTGGGPMSVELINDGWFDGQMVAFQMGFVQDECWASTYQPLPEHYPLELTGATLLLGGNTDQQMFDIGIYDVNAGGSPMTRIDGIQVAMTGSDSQLNSVDFEQLGLTAPRFDQGNFAIAVCLLAHDGFPAIARDDDGNITPDRNWLFTGGTWRQAGDLGLTGDWIMRAIIRAGVE